MDYDITKILPEQVWENNLPNVPVYVVDFQVFAHSIHAYLSSAIDLSLYPGREDEIIRALWAVKINRGPDMLPQMDFTCVVVDDYKGAVDGAAAESAEGYWRHIVAQEYGLQEYKLGRSTKPELFHKVKEVGYAYILAEKSPFLYFKQVYMEADDLAGKIARLKRSAPAESVAANRELILGTVDGDWQGLVSDKDHIIWANTGPWLPRLRDEKAVCDYYLRKNKTKITSARECYDIKAIFGDAGDGLKPGSPLRLFDLWNEDQEYSFSEHIESGLARVLDDPKPNNRADHLEAGKKFLFGLGLIPPLAEPVEESDAQAFHIRAQSERDKALKLEGKGKLKKKCAELEDLDQVSFEDCVEMSIQDWNTMKSIKENKEMLEKCEKTDTECIKFFKNIISNLEKIRKDLSKSVDLLTKAIKRSMM